MKKLIRWILTEPYEKRAALGFFSTIWKYGLFTGKKGT